MGKLSHSTEQESCVIAYRNFSHNRKLDKLWCDHYKRVWNTRETCWKVNGKTTNQKKKNGNEGLALYASNFDQG